ncbi:MAG TPA: ATP-binding protein [Rhodobacteraceae bacterium]|jgi:capsular polysaccharide transport system ATP-binding protein|nr:ATP-binding protein [Paracoccaceae bacterium]HBV56398.1 ATP-binding protein [Paracoccaceae bacterium]
MITFINVNKSYTSRGTRQIVARDLSVCFPSGQCLGLLGRNGAGKSSLLRLIAGLLRPDTGEIRRHGTVSWPIGFQGSFHPDLTGAENTRFVARLYGRDSRETLDFVADFAELGAHLRQPVRVYSSGMRARLAFALSMAVPFDTYLIDEVTSVGDAGFREKSEAILQDRLKSAGAIVVSHSLDLLRRICGPGAVLENGRIFYYQRVERAIEHHHYLLKGALPPWLK